MKPVVYFVRDGDPLFRRFNDPSADETDLPGTFQRWTGDEWVVDWRWYPEVLDGDSSYDLIDEADAREKFPTAFLTSRR